MNTPVPPRGPKKAKGSSARGRQAAFQKKKQQKRLAIGGVALAAVIVLVLVLVAVTQGSKSGGSNATPSADASLIKTVESVTPQAMAQQAGADTLLAYPQTITGPALTSEGKPQITYVGAEYCPYCAGERWAMVMALSKFGTFSGLKQITSSSTDSPSSIPTFSFLGATYTSPYLVFDHHETETVNRTPLEKLPTADTFLLAKYDSGQSIPFVDFGGKWNITGASYSVPPLQHVSHATVAGWASTASTKVGADIQSTAGMIVSHICALTVAKPASVCRYFPRSSGADTMATVATSRTRSAEPAMPATPRWPAIAGLVITVAGIAVATYLTYAHYDTHIQLACPDKGFINCGQVTTSSYSKVFGVPVALLGLLFFLSMLPLQLPVAWRSISPLIRRVRLAATVIGVGFIIWLLYAELIKIQKLCLYCTSVHVLTFALFVVTVCGTIATTPVLGDEVE